MRICSGVVDNPDVAACGGARGEPAQLCQVLRKKIKKIRKKKLWDFVYISNIFSLKTMTIRDGDIIKPPLTTFLFQNYSLIS